MIYGASESKTGSVFAKTRRDSGGRNWRHGLSGQDAAEVKRIAGRH
jgi:hypothetical protein